MVILIRTGAGISLRTGAGIPCGVHHAEGDRLYVAIVATTDAKAIPEPRMTTGGACISTYLVVSAWRLLECRVFPRSRHHHLRPIQFRRANRSAGQRPGLGFNAPSYAAPGNARNSIRAIRLADHSGLPVSSCSGLPVSSFLQLESYQKYQLTEYVRN